MTGVRSAVITLRAPGRQQEIVLYPMLHLGSPQFYADVAAGLRECDVIVAEGIRGRSLITEAVTAAYRLPGRSRRLALVRQRIDYAGLTAEVITPDMTGAQLHAGWRRVPVLQRVALLLAAPVVGVFFWLVGTRRILARYAATEDLPGDADIILRDKAQALTELILDRRDALLGAALDEILARPGGETARIAVVYGAGHMAALTRYLYARYGYRARHAEWLTVLDF